MPQVLSPYTDLASGEAIIDATKTWPERAVIGLNLCPFAKSVFVKKQVRYALTAAADADGLLAELEHELTLLAETDPEQLDTTLLIHPLAMTDFLDYHFFLGEVEIVLHVPADEHALEAGSLIAEVLQCGLGVRHVVAHRVTEGDVVGRAVFDSE